MAEKQPLRALVVDDDPSMVQLLERILHQEFPNDFQIKATTDPVEAMDCLRSEIIDLLITDLEMPEVGGLELLHCAKQASAWMQVLIITGHSNVHALMEAMNLGANDYLLKPLDICELEEVLKSNVNRSRRWRDALAGTVTPCGITAAATA